MKNSKKEKSEKKRKKPRKPGKSTISEGCGFRFAILGGEGKIRNRRVETPGLNFSKNLQIFLILFKSL